MDNLNDLVPISPKDKMNVNLSSAQEGTMRARFGVAGTLSADCSEPNGHFVKRIKYGVDVGPFDASGLDVGIESLCQLFAEVKSEIRSAMRE